MNKDNIKVFVSHKSSDIELAKTLVKLLTASLELSNEDIRCTSVPGFRFGPGIDTTAAIRKEINESSILICLLTPESLQSSFVLFELGARWGVEKPLIPLLAHGAGFDDLPSPIRDKNALKLDTEENLYDLIESISEHLEISGKKISSYTDELSMVISEAIKKSLKLLKKINQKK